MAPENLRCWTQSASLYSIKVLERFKEQFIEGASEIDLVRSGLDDMMREAYQKVRHSMIENDIPNLRTAAYKVALDRIAISYDSIGL